MSDKPLHTISIKELPVALNQSSFMINLVSKLSQSLEDVVGLEEASGFISIVGGKIGKQIGDEYAQNLGQAKLDRHQVAEVLVDLKRRIGGDFRLVEQDNSKLVFLNSKCPFGAAVIGQRSLCMMTSTCLEKLPQIIWVMPALN